MRNTVSKAIVASVAAVAFGAALVATTEPAAAGSLARRGRRLAGDGGGWHGGGWHGGWRSARGGAWHRLLARRRLVRRLVGSRRGRRRRARGGRDRARRGDPYGIRVRLRLSERCVQVRPLYAPNGAWIGNGPVNVCQ